MNPYRVPVVEPDVDWNIIDVIVHGPVCHYDRKTRCPTNDEAPRCNNCPYSHTKNGR